MDLINIFFGWLTKGSAHVSLFDIIMLIIELIIVIMIGYGVLYIYSFFYRIGKKNCFDCEHYNYDDNAWGSNCYYKCNKLNRKDLHNVNGVYEHYEKCKDFKLKEKKE